MSVAIVSMHPKNIVSVTLPKTCSSTVLVKIFRDFPAKVTIWGYHPMMRLFLLKGMMGKVA